MIVTTCPHCWNVSTLDAGAIILARHMPSGHGAMSYQCVACTTPMCLLLTLEEVMHAVFAGAHPIDVETVP